MESLPPSLKQIKKKKGHGEEATNLKRLGIGMGMCKGDGKPNPTSFQKSTWTWVSPPRSLRKIFFNLL